MVPAGPGRDPIHRWILVGAMLCFSLAGTPVANGSDLEFFTVNDLLSPNVDDQYTAMLGVAFSTEQVRYALYEHLFTDQARELRFDETHLIACRDLPEVSGWRINAGAGLVHVGEGLLGQSFQNWIHRLINSSELFLPYIEESDFHARIRFRATRAFPLGKRWTAGPLIESDAAFGFKWHTTFGAEFRWRKGDRFSLHGSMAARYSDTSLDALRPWMDGWAPAGEIGIQYARFLKASYSYNAYGTEDFHIHIHLIASFP